MAPWGRGRAFWEKQATSSRHPLPSFLQQQGSAPAGTLRTDASRWCITRFETSGCKQKNCNYLEAAEITEVPEIDTSHGTTPGPPFMEISRLQHPRMCLGEFYCIAPCLSVSIPLWPQLYFREQTLFGKKNTYICTSSFLSLGVFL